MSSTPHTPCAACKCRRQKCTQECIFAPYFRPDNPQKFENVHKVFGASNVAKILHDLPPQHRADAANSLDYEAQCRIQDPIYGCVSLIASLQNRFNQVMGDLELAKNELATYMGPYNPQPSLQQMALVGEQERLRAYVQQQQQQQVQQADQGQHNDGMVNFIADFDQMARVQQGETSHQIQTHPHLQQHSLFQSNPQFYRGENELRANSSLLREQVQLNPYQSGEKNDVRSQGSLLREHVQLNPQYYPPQAGKNELWPHNSLLREQVQPSSQQRGENEVRLHGPLLMEQVQPNLQYHPQQSDENELRSQVQSNPQQSKPHHHPH